MSLDTLNSQYETVQVIVPLTQNAWTRLVGVDVRRWSILFAQPSGGQTCYVSTTQPTQNVGILVASAYPPVIITARDMPGGVAGVWYGFTTGIGQQLSILTTRDISVRGSEG